jgi:hypothetical protein
MTHDDADYGFTSRRDDAERPAPGPGTPTPVVRPQRPPRLPDTVLHHHGDGGLWTGPVDRLPPGRGWTKVAVAPEGSEFALERQRNGQPKLITRRINRSRTS